MIGTMSEEPSSEDFVLSIVNVFTLTGRSAVVIGPVESGVIRSGESVEIWDGDALVCAAPACPAEGSGAATLIHDPSPCCSGTSIRTFCGQAQTVRRSPRPADAI
jgi:uncharacterized protein YcgI (DUF1989 family)